MFQGVFRKIIGWRTKSIMFVNRVNWKCQIKGDFKNRNKTDSFNVKAGQAIIIEQDERR